MSGIPSLDSFGEVYPGFSRHREIVKAGYPDIESAWERFFEVVGRMESFYQRSDEDVARETMRALLLLLPAKKK